VNFLKRNYEQTDQTWDADLPSVLLGVFLPFYAKPRSAEPIRNVVQKICGIF
jgi:hypothetical protein